MVEIDARFEIQPDIEDEHGFLAVQVGEFGLEFDQRIVGAGNVARAAGATPSWSPSRTWPSPSPVTPMPR